MSGTLTCAEAERWPTGNSNGGPWGPRISFGILLPWSVVSQTNARTPEGGGRSHPWLGVLSLGCRESPGT